MVIPLVHWVVHIIRPGASGNFLKFDSIFPIDFSIRKYTENRAA